MLSDELILQTALKEGVDIEALVAVDEDERPSERDPWDVYDECELDVEYEMAQQVRADIFRVLFVKVGGRISLDQFDAVRNESYVTDQLTVLSSERARREALETMCIDIAEVAIETVLRREGVLTNDDWKTHESKTRTMRLIRDYALQLCETLNFSTLNDDLPASMTAEQAHDICTAAMNKRVDLENFFAAMDIEVENGDTWIDGDDQEDDSASPVNVSYDWELRCTIEKLMSEHGAEVTVRDLASFLNNGFATDLTLGDEEAKSNVRQFLSYAMAEQSLRSVEQLQPYLDRFERGSQEEELFLTSLTFRMMRELGFDVY